MSTTEIATEVTGYITDSNTQHAPVRLIGPAPGGMLKVETLEGGTGGWNRAGKLITISPRIFEQD